MSDFIIYKSNQPVNLDFVCSIFQSSHKSYKEVWFIFPSMNNDEQMEVAWKFETREEAVKVYNHLVSTVSTSISDEIFIGEES